MFFFQVLYFFQVSQYRTWTTDLYISLTDIFINLQEEFHILFEFLHSKVSKNNVFSLELKLSSCYKDLL